MFSFFSHYTTIMVIITGNIIISYIHAISNIFTILNISPNSVISQISAISANPISYLGHSSHFISLVLITYVISIILAILQSFAIIVNLVFCLTYCIDFSHFGQSNQLCIFVIWTFPFFQLFQ